MPFMESSDINKRSHSLGHSVREDIKKVASASFSFSKPQPTQASTPPARAPSLGAPRKTDERERYINHERTNGSVPNHLQPFRREESISVSSSQVHPEITSLNMKRGKRILYSIQSSVG